MNLRTMLDLYKLQRLYRRYSKAMYKEAIRILDDKPLAEDAVQESIRKAAPHLHKIDENNRPRTCNYLVTICRNTAIDILRKRSKEQAYGSLDTFEDKEADPLELIINKETVNELSEIIKELPDIYRDVFLMRVVEEHSRAEIAEMLNISLDAVDKRLSRAKKMIRQEYERRYGRYE